MMKRAATFQGRKKEIRVRHRRASGVLPFSLLTQRSFLILFPYYFILLSIRILLFRIISFFGKSKDSRTAPLMQTQTSRNQTDRNTQCGHNFTNILFRRVMVSILLAFFMLVLYLQRVVISVAIVPIAEEQSLTTEQQGLLLSSFFWCVYECGHIS